MYCTFEEVNVRAREDKTMNIEQLNKVWDDKVACDFCMLLKVRMLCKCEILRKL